MHQLSLESYPTITPLVKASGMRGHLALVDEIIEGRLAGRVFVDSPNNPRAALLCSSNGFTFAFGEPVEEIARPQIENLLKENRRDIYAFLFGSNAVWKPLLDKIFLPYGIQPAPRLAFELHGFPSMPVIPPEYRLEPIDARLARSILDGTGTGGFGIDPWFIKIAGGPEAYAALNLGYALTVEGDGARPKQIAALAGICGLSREEAELEVGTTLAYRGRGLGTLVSAAFMHQCRERGLLPAYSCASDNLPSIGVARKLGYVPIEEIHGYPLFFN